MRLRLPRQGVDWASCGYVPRKSETRASRIEWEHVVPAWNLGHQRQCWQQGGRKNCAASDPVFRMAEGDLNNLVPAVGEVNGDRANFAYGAWSRKPTTMYGQCQSVTDFGNKRFQPREEVRGVAARITLYMHARYQLRMSRQDQQLMCAWARQYPVNAWERRRDARIVQLQGEGNFSWWRSRSAWQSCAELERRGRAALFDRAVHAAHEIALTK
ncbi:endonuclease [Chromobacterium haemolyticum]|nr:endonuclease [Chromobacterium haemolyticum]